MTAVLKLTFLFVLVAVVASASTKQKGEEKQVAVAVEDEDFPSDESVRVDGEDETEEDRLHKKKKKHHGLAGLLASLIKPKPHKEAEDEDKKIHALKKTKVIEVTKRVLVNPVCMTVHGNKPSCSPEQNTKSNDDEGLYYIEPTATPKLGDFLINDEDEDQIAISRSARYLSFATPGIAQVKSSIDEEEIEGVENEEEVEVDEMGRFIFHKHPKKKPVFHTVYVTKVQQIVDTKVTATLAVANCIPANSNIPLCPQKPAFKKPIEGSPLWKEENTKEMNVTEEVEDEFTEGYVI